MPEGFLSLRKITIFVKTTLVMSDSPTIRHKGDYKTLLCYQKAETIYDVTYFFVEHFLERGDRTCDQMIQAARSGKQNIVEGYAASATSVEMELKLMNVAKSSLHELLMDYDDYLRVRGLTRWAEDSEQMQRAKQLGREHNDSAFWRELIQTRSAETIANLAIVLIYQADSLIYRFMQRVLERFAEEGGFREQLTRLRLQNRNKF